MILLIVIALAAVYWATHRHTSMRGGGGPGARGAHAPAQAVRVAKIVRGEIPIVRNALGTVTPLAQVTVRTQLSGILQSVGFKEGQHVKKGDFLAQIDPRSYEISQRLAEGSLQRDQALLAQAIKNLERYRVLLQQDSIARQTYDDQVSLVAQYRGTVLSDQAQIDAYKLDLQYARITAPVDGRVGLRKVDPGNYVTSGDTNGIVVITQLQPISVLFTLPEDDVRQVSQRLAQGARLSASAFDRTNTTELALGSLATMDNLVDTTTGTVQMRADFANGNEALFPNQFVNVRLLVDTQRDVLIAPSAAIQTGASGPYVYVVNADNTVSVRNVKPGVVDGERTAVLDGLKLGETVVIDGVDRLREGARITVPAAASGSAAAGAAGASGGAANLSAVPGAATGRARPPGSNNRGMAHAASTASADSAATGPTSTTNTTSATSATSTARATR